jgi:hypothetical protein
MNYEDIEEARRRLLKANLDIPETLIDALTVDALFDGNSNSESLRDLNELVACYADQILLSKKAAFYLSEVQPGEIKIGRYVQGDRINGAFGIFPNDLQHCGIFAGTGSGKTTLILTITTRTKVWTTIIDFKRDYRGLVKTHDFKAVRWEWLKINPLEPPPNVPVVQWMTFLADVMAHVFGWFHASENYLMQFMQQAYDSKQVGYPTFRELHDLVALDEPQGRRYSEYREVCLNRLSSTLLVLKDVFDTEISFPIEKLLDQNIILEFDGLARDPANFLVELILARVYCYRLANFQRGEISHLWVFDDALRSFYKGRLHGETVEALGLPWLEQVPLIIRDYKEGLLCASQQPSLMSSSITSNLRTIFVGYLSNGEDIDSVCTSLNLDEDERKEFAKIGEKGYWLVKKAGVKPFVIKTEDFPIPKDMTDEELRQRMRGFVEELDKQRKEVVVTSRPKIVEPPKVIPPQLAPDAWNVLVNVCEHPFMGIRSRSYRLKISGRRIETAVAELAKKQLVATLPIPLGNYRPVKFIILTNEALNLLRNVGHEASLWKKIGNVGFEHSLYQVLIAYSFRKRGYDATIEKKLASGRRLDVYCNDGKSKMGIEIELTTTNIEEKVEGIDELDSLVILVKDEESLRDGVIFLKARPAMKKVRIQKVSEFLRENSTRNSGSPGRHQPSFSGTNPNHGDSGMKV